jgi:amylosucrase
VHRPQFPAERYAKRTDPSTPEGAVFDGLKRMTAVRAGTPELAGTRLIPFATDNRGVLGYQRPGDGTRILVLANFSDDPQVVTAETLSGFAAEALDLFSGDTVRISQGIVLRPQDYAWLRVVPAG